MEDYSMYNKEGIMTAANYAGRVINIAQTTAPRAMNYKLTSMYGLPHGHSVALCLPVVWHYIINHPEQSIDPRGKSYLLSIFDDIARVLECSSANEAAVFMQNLPTTILELEIPIAKNRENDLAFLTNSVNPIRLKDNPIELLPSTLYQLYNSLLDNNVSL